MSRGVVEHPERVLRAGEVVDDRIGLAVENLERVNQVEAVAHGLFLKALPGSVGVKIFGLHVERARGGLDLHAMDVRLKRERGAVEVAIPHLRLTSARSVLILTRKEAAQRGLVELEDARDEAGADGQRHVGERLCGLGERNPALDLEALQIHDGQRAVFILAGAVPRLDIVGDRDHESPVADAGQVRIVLRPSPPAR